MAIFGKDGKRYHSASRAQMHGQMNSEHTGSPSSSAKTKPSEHTGAAEPKGAGNDISHMDVHEAVEAHGPAHKIMVDHDHEAGKHMVTAHHHGGKVHKSSHSTAQDAHESAMRSAGVGGGLDDEENMTPTEDFAANGGIPGLNDD